MLGNHKQHTSTPELQICTEVSISIVSNAIIINRPLNCSLYLMKWALTDESYATMVSPSVATRLSVVILKKIIIPHNSAPF